MPGPSLLAVSRPAGHAEALAEAGGPPRNGLPVNDLELLVDNSAGETLDWEACRAEGRPP
jgi:hypothetical protein